MAIDTIKSSAVLDGAIATADIADSAVTTAKVANDAITGDKVSNTLVIASQLQTPSVAGSADTDTSVSFPGSNIVQMNNAATARHKFHTLNGNSLFEVQASSTGGSGAGGAFLKFKGSNGTPVDIASIDGSMTNGSIGSESGIFSFFTMNAGTNSEKVRIFSNGSMAVPNGISIGNGISAAASNLLDDYEEGTFTPSVGGNATYNSQIGKYIKIGRSVTIKLEMHINVLGTGSTSTVTGIPFAADTEAPLAVAKATNTSAAYGEIQARIAGTTLYYMTRQGNVTNQGTNTAIHANNFLIQCSGSYITGT